MKDIYELFNDINIDENEFEEIAVSEREKAKIKGKLKKSIGKKSLGAKKKICVAAAILFISLSSIIVAKPTFAKNIPLIGHLFEKELVSTNKDYAKYENVINKTKSYKGIDVTFESAAVDKNMMFLNFVVKNNNKEIKNEYMEALLIPTSMKINNKNVNVGGGASWEFVDNNTIRVLKKIDLSSQKVSDEMNIDIQISKLFGVSGDFGVKFFLDKSEQEKKTIKKDLNVDLDIKGVKGKISDIEITPLTVTINGEGNYGTMEDDSIPELDFVILDDKGNSLRWQGGYGNDFNSEKGKIKWSNTFIANNNMKNLTIIPEYRIGSMENEKLPPVKLDLNNVKPINLVNNEDKSINIKDYLIDGDYLIIKYVQKYFDKEVKSGVFDKGVYVMSKGKNIDEITDYNSVENIYNKYSSPNYKIRIFKAKGKRNFMVGTYNMLDGEVLKDKIFKVDLEK